MDIGNIGNFEIIRDPKGSRNVVLNNKWFLIQGFHQTLADNLASKLNSIVHDPKIREDLTNYRTVREKRDISISQFEEHLETLLHGIELKSKDLLGACDHCLSLHPKKEISRLQPLLSQID